MAEIFSDLVVQFSPAGLEVVQAGMGKIVAGMDATAQSVSGTFAAMANEAARWGKSWEQTAATVAGAAQKGFGTAGYSAGKAGASATAAATAASGAASQIGASWSAAADTVAGSAQKGFGSAGASATGAASAASAAAKTMGSSFAGAGNAASDAAKKGLGFDAVSKSVVGVNASLVNVVAIAGATGRAFAKAFQDPSAPLSSFGEAVKTLGPKMAASMVAFGQQARQVSDSLRTGFLAAAGALSPLVVGIGGLVVAGVHASAAGQVMSIQFEELSRQIASIFSPTIYAIINKLAELARWFRSLTAEQQASYRWLGLTAAGVVAVAAVAPKLIAGFQAIRVAILAANAAAVASPWLLFAAVIGGAILHTYGWEKALRDLTNVVETLGKIARGVFDDLASAIKQATPVIEGAVSPLLSASKILSGREGEREKQGATQKAAGGIVDALTQSLVPAGSLRQIMAGINTDAGQTALKWAANSRLLQTMGFGISSVAKALVKGPESEKKGDQLLPPLRGFESIDAAYRRISEASIRATAGKGYRSAQEEARDLLKDMYLKMEGWDGVIKGGPAKPVLK